MELATNPSKINRYRPDIDGLRGIAVVVVILFHLNKTWIPGGFTGVDIFFVISGYVVTASIINHHTKNVLDYFLGFYARRVKRIFPALICCIAVSTLLVIAILPTSEALKLIKPGIWSLLGWNNNFLIWTSTDYFNTDQNLNPFLHTWSLGVEEQFYFVFPIVLLLIYGLKRPLEKKRGFKSWISIGITLMSAVLSMWLSFTNPTWAYYFMPSRFWELGAGALLFILIAENPKFTINAYSWVNQFFQVAAVVLIGVSLFAIDEKVQFPFPWALPSVLGTLMFIVSGLREKNLLYRLVGSSPLVYIGKLSYSLYLWHWPIFTLFNWTIGLNSLIHVILALFATFAFSLTFYYGVEKPVREFKTSHIKNWKIILVGLGAILPIISLMFMGFKNGVFLEKFSVRKYPKDTLSYDKGDWRDPNSSLIPGYPQITSGNCMSPEGNYYSPDKVNLDLCTTHSNSTRTQTIFLIGDSHAVHLFPMFHQILQHNTNIRLLTTWRWNCIVSDSLDTISGNNRGHCKEFTEGEIRKAMKLLKPGDIVTISTSLNLQLTGLGHSLEPDISRTDNTILNGVKIDQNTKLNEYARSLERIAKQFSQMGVKTVLWVDTPEMKINPLACSDVFSVKISRTNCSPQKGVLARKQDIILEVFERVQSSNNDVYIFNPNDILIPQGEFKFIDDSGLFLMEDINHLSPYAARQLANPFYQFLQRNNLILEKRES